MEELTPLSPAQLLHLENYIDEEIDACEEEDLAVRYLYLSSDVFEGFQSIMQKQHGAPVDLYRGCIVRESKELSPRSIELL